jgi:hypothetical protein
VYFKSGRDEAFDRQLARLRELLSEVAEILEPAALGSRLPEAEAALFLQLLGDAFKQLGQLKTVGLPLLIITSEFGTVSMWDWEIDAVLRAEGLKTFAPYTLELTRKVCRALGLRREMRSTRFLVFQDSPGEGMQADIFKRFYWWEERCVDLIKKKFGVTVVKKSFKKLAERAKKIPDQEAAQTNERWKVDTKGLPERGLYSALKLYLAVKEEVESDTDIRGAGMNCLNESFYSDITPCLAWNLLFEESGLIWACEGDVMTLISKYLLRRSLQSPIMMSNIYPFLMGMAVLKHERIQGFPEVPDPEDHLLMAHCGYLGVLPESFSAGWKLKPKVLAIVDENASAIDARLPEGDITLSKLHPSLDRIFVAEGRLEGYVQYPDSDCKNGAVVRVRDGHRFMERLYSHHKLLIQGRRGVEIGFLARVFELAVDEV